MSILVPCPGCQRHVRSAEAACPFCGNGLPQNLAARAVPATTRRMDRLATFTFAAALAVAGATGVGCSSGGEEIDEQQTEDELRRRKDAAAADSGCRPVEDNGAIVAMYGLPPATPVDDRPPCPREAGSPDDDDAGAVVALYGAPPLPEEDGGAIQPMYGLPPPPPVNDGGGIMPMYGLPPSN